MKNYISIIIFLLMILLTLFGCKARASIPINNPSSENESSSKQITEPLSQNSTSAISNSSSTINIDLSKVNYISLENCFLGTFENGKWNSAQIERDTKMKKVREISINELIKDNHYFLYSKYQKKGETHDYKSDLNEETHDLFYFRYHFRIDKKEIENVILGITSGHNPLPKSIVKSTKIIDKQIDAVRKIMDEHGLNGTKVHINEVYTMDIDSDGINEEVIIAGTPIDKNGYPIIHPDDRFKSDTGVYISAILLKGDKVFPVYYSQVKLKDLHYSPDLNGLGFSIDSTLSISFLGVFDLNKDGKFEICLQNWIWDCPEIKVFEWQNNCFNQVLYGDFT